MQKKYYIEITETLQKVVEVYAESEEEAKDKVHLDYTNGKEVLTSENWVDTLIDVYSLESDYENAKVIFPEDMKPKEEVNNEN